MVKQKSRRLVLNRFHPLSQNMMMAFLFAEGGGNKVWDAVKISRYNPSIGNLGLAVGTLGSAGHVKWGYGPFGPCLVGDGFASSNINDRLSIVGGPSTTPQSSGTFSVWIKPNASLSGYGAILTSGGSQGFWLRGSLAGGSNLCMDAFFGGGDHQSPPLTDKVWQHYCFTSTGQLPAFVGNHYINGKLVATQTCGLQLGYDCMFCDTASESFTGSLDLPMTWARELKPNEVMQLYTDPLCMFDEPRVRIFPTPTLSVFIRPDADDSDSGWTDQGGGTSNLYLTIDEAAPANDADYIQSSVNPTSDVVRFRISDPTAAMVEPLNVRYRYGVVGGGAYPVQITARLKQGSTIIKEWVHKDASPTFQTVTQTLTSGEYASITNFNNLFVEFVAGKSPDPVVTFLGWFHQEDGAFTQTQSINFGTDANVLIVIGAMARVGNAADVNVDITIGGGSPINKDVFWNDSNAAWPVTIQSQFYSTGPGTASVLVAWSSVQAGQPRDIYAWKITNLASGAKKNTTHSLHATTSMQIPVSAGDILISVVENQNLGTLTYAASTEAPTHQYKEPGGPAYNITMGADWAIQNSNASFTVDFSGGAAPDAVAVSYR
jgi:Concanavalin A-like lectin/glucanases superfamily